MIRALILALALAGCAEPPPTLYLNVVMHGARNNLGTFPDARDCYFFRDEMARRHPEMIFSCDRTPGTSRDQ